jgi:hypothetical protein
MATKLSANPNYGTPSARKMKSRMAGFLAWAAGMRTLKQIHDEEKEVFAAKATADNALLDAGRWS